MIAIDHAPGETEALRDWRGREVFPTDLGSAEIRGLGRELHRRSIFTARGTNAEHLQEIADVVDEILGGKINMDQGRWKLMRKLKQLGYDPTTGFPGDVAKVPPAERGSLQDLSSAQRIDLILETNVRMASNYARMVAGNTPYALHAYPAWELVRFFHRDVPRGSPESKSLGWERRWSDAGESVLWDGAKEKRMIARKDSPIWQALGDGDGGGYTDTLGNPYPPFAFRSGMAWRAVPRAECVALGLVTGDETPAKMEGQLEPGEKEVRLVIENLSPDLRAEMRRQLSEGAETARLAQAAAAHRERQAAIKRERIARGAQVQAEHRARMERLGETRLPAPAERGTLPQHESDPTEDQGHHPESAAADLRRICGASGGGPPIGFGAQQNAVEQWARERGLWLPWRAAAAGAVQGGVEHLVRADIATGRIVKTTIAPAFGRFAGVDRAGLPALFEATPLEYLERWRLHNERFASGTKVIGATVQRAGFPSLIISQRYISGPPPKIEDLVASLSRQGFERIAGTWVFYDAPAGLAIFDARPANFAWSQGEAVALDVIPALVDARMREALMRLEGRA